MSSGIGCSYNGIVPRICKVADAAWQQQDADAAEAVAAAAKQAVRPVAAATAPAKLRLPCGNDTALHTAQWSLDKSGFGVSGSSDRSGEFAVHISDLWVPLPTR